MGKPLVSIVIPVYNGSDYLEEAIDSVLNQTYENCEVLVVNDGSCDEGRTEAVALSFGDRIRYFSKKNGGVASALNFGIQKMRGEYFSWLSHDDFLYPEKIEREIEELERSKAGLVFCSYDVLRGEGRKTRIRLTDHFEKYRLEQGTLSVLNAMIQFGGVLFQRDLFEKYGMFREDLRTTQDYEFLFRVLKRETICYLDMPLYAIRYHDSQGSRTISSVQKDADEMFLMFLNHISDEERRAAYGSVYNYYYRMYLSILPQPHLVKSLDQCKSRLKECFEERGREETGLPDEKGSSMARECLAPLLEGKRIYIYGCGNYGKRLKKDLEFRGFFVEGFIDSNPQLWEKDIAGVKCVSLEDVRRLDGDVLVIAAALFVEDIMKILCDDQRLEIIPKKVIDEVGMEFPPDIRDVL